MKKLSPDIYRKWKVRRLDSGQAKKGTKIRKAKGTDLHYYESNLRMIKKRKFERKRSRNEKRNF